MNNFSNYSYIDTDKQINTLIDELSSKCKICGLDLEADSLYSYEEKLCLMQFIHESGIVIIDPLKITNLSTFIDFLAEREVWMHGADYDFYILKNTFNKIPKLILDTQVAAKLCGIKNFSLAKLVKKFYSTELLKGGQKADWSKRPLSDNMLEYAANDVRYLIGMADILKKKLKKLGRYDWLIETCKENRINAINKEKKDNSNAWKIKGSGEMGEKSLNILYIMWQWRDYEAKKADLPHFKIINNYMLISIVEKIRNNLDVKISFNWNEGRKKRFYNSIEKASKEKKIIFPKNMKKRKKRFTKPKDFDNKINSLILKRNQKANELNIENTVIASYKMLEEYIYNQYGNNINNNKLLKWQKSLLEI